MTQVNSGSVAQLYNGFQIDIDVDAVLRSQGADPEVIRSRRPALLRVAEEAIREGTSLLHPMAWMATFPVQAFRNGQLELANGSILTGDPTAEQLAAAERVSLILCTLGTQLEERIDQEFSQNPVLALALDGLGTAAVDRLAMIICQAYDDLANSEGKKTSIPISPGMIGWPIEDGQPQIFSVLKPPEELIELQIGNMMKPRKSISMVIGTGPTLNRHGRTCDYCGLKDTCNFKSRHAVQI